MAAELDGIKMNVIRSEIAAKNAALNFSVYKLTSRVKAGS